MLRNVVHVIALLLLSSVKFLFAPAAILADGFSIAQTLIISISGGCFGVLIFFYFGKMVLEIWHKRNQGKKVDPKKKFNRKNRFIIRTKNSFGIYGLALLTPVLLSIPVGSILAARYFSHQKKTLFILLASVIFWSFTLTLIFSFLEN